MDIKGSQAVILPEGAFVIGTYDAEGKPDAMIAAWGAQSDYGEITFFLAKHKTTENIKVTKAFTVAFATEETMVISRTCSQGAACQRTGDRGISSDAGM